MSRIEVDCLSRSSDSTKRKESKSRIRLLTAAWLTFCLPLSAVSTEAKTGSAPSETANSATIREAHLAEPLIASTRPSDVENSEFALAVGNYELRTSPDDLSSLEAFVKTHPDSPWTPSVLYNLGLSYLHYGYFSRALDAWEGAWKAGRNATDPDAKKVVDGAVARLAWLRTSLGQTKEAEALFAELGSRQISGSATEFLQNAREQINLAKANTGHIYLCGPVALSVLMLDDGASHQQVRFVHTYRAGPSGTSLAEVGRLATDSKFAHRLVFRRAGQKIPVPSIVHWRVGHFAAIMQERDGKYRIDDPVFPDRAHWISKEVIEAESTGYFLVPVKAGVDQGWRDVAETEAANVWGKGQTNDTRPGDANDPPVHPDPDDCPLCAYNIAESSVAITLSDTPVGYDPPIGPSAKVKVTYNQREASQPQVFSYFNVSPKWSINWLTYVTDDPNNVGASVSRYLSGGGAFYYSGYNAQSGRFNAQDTDGSLLILSAQNPIRYRRLLSDGSVEIYAQSDGSSSYPRNIFLSQIIDPQGNALTLNYDGQKRLVSLTDAAGRQTTFTYGLAARPLLITAITDPFGRSANLTYDASGRLSSITDIIGLTSRFSYDANSLVNALTTPYGTTSFAYTAPGTSGPPRFVQVTDPLGLSERVEWVEPGPTPGSDPAATVPQGTSIPLTNQYLNYRNSYYWDRNAYIVAGCGPTGGCDYTKARITHFTHVPPNTSIKDTNIESIKYPLENRIWYLYPGQTNSLYSGSFQKPTSIARVLDDGSTQLSQAAYDTNGFFKLTQSTDPLGRTTSFSYSNHIDLAAVTQRDVNGKETFLAQFVYNLQHRPTLMLDAALQTSSFAYNAQGQLASSTNPLGQSKHYNYDGSARLASIVNENNATSATFAYDGFDRVATYTDSEGWSASFQYDAADRVTQIAYPDGTSDRYSYDKLDLSAFTDRLGRKWTYAYDADRRMVASVDPSGATIQYGYNPTGKLASLTDAKNNITTWTYDVQGRLTSKKYADNSTVTYAYENTTSRLKSVTDALGQLKQLSYAADDRVISVNYLNALNSTPNVQFTYDRYFPRLTSMVDGIGTTTISYVDPGTLGALKLLQSSGPFANSTIAYAYDALGRIASRTVAQSAAQTFQYDALGRLISDANELGSFSLSYLGQTNQITGHSLAASVLATTWSYLPNSGDRRLASINNTGLSSATYSNFQFTTDAENYIRGITETSDAAPAYPSASTQTASFNNLNQLTNLSSQALTYDANGNLTSDGQRTFSWDAENRLVAIAYPSQSGKATAFAYDGFGRRLTITSTPAGGSAATTNYLWCGSFPCQARDASNAATRAYYDEGEFTLGASPQSVYYGVDQIGSTRRAFVFGANAPAYSYDAWGNELSGATKVTDFGFAGMFNNADSGLNLTQYRAYDPIVGRWLSRDPIGENTDPRANLYAYVGGNPLANIDPLGLADIPSPNNIPGGPWEPAGPGQRPGTYFGPPQQSGPRSACRWVPPYGEGGPPGSQGYWKTKMPDQRGWSRYDPNGNPLSPEEAHPNPLAPNPLSPFIRYGGPVGAFIGATLYSTPAY